MLTVGLLHACYPHRVLQANRQKLLLVLSFFRPPQEETTRLVAGRSSFYLDSDLSRKWSQFEDPELSDLALQASKHLVGSCR